MMRVGQLYWAIWITWQALLIWTICDFNIAKCKTVYLRTENEGHRLLSWEAVALRRMEEMWQTIKTKHGFFGVICSIKAMPFLDLSVRKYYLARWGWSWRLKTITDSYSIHFWCLHFQKENHQRTVNYADKSFMNNPWAGKPVIQWELRSSIYSASGGKIRRWLGHPLKAVRRDTFQRMEGSLIC